jgi:UDP-N-acetylglucosamine 2-epimerase (non-hydrolysing)
MISLACIVGARPNFMKMSALVAEFRRRPGFQTSLIHTGQHFSPEMSQTFFDELDLPKPDLNLGIAGGTLVTQTAEIMTQLERVFVESRPDMVLVVGDVTSTISAALVAARLGIPLAHVEAGLRSFDRRMPEEINRIVTDTLADFLFVTEPSGVKNLVAEGVAAERIHLVGNVMIDTLLRFRTRASRSDVVERLGLKPKRYAVVTLHRPSNVDNPAHLRGLLHALTELAAQLPVVFPVHPRTRGTIEAAGLDVSRLLLTPPLGYLEFLRLMSEARLVLTDSGGIQEETTILRVPCLTLRENTERPITIEKGTNRLIGANPDRILRAAMECLGREGAPAETPELWDGQASGRIATVLEEAMMPEAVGTL